MAAPSSPSLTPSQLDGYVSRLGVDPRGAPADLDTLQAIHLAHLERIPFENLDIVFGDGVSHDQSIAVEKIIGSGSRGGWCFELNGALALLLESLGYQVRLLGAAVLLDGPTEVIEHLMLDVSSPLLAPHLADVGFGDSFATPLSLNTTGAQDGGSGMFELIGSPQGTTVTRLVDGVPAALLRFKRVAHRFEDFAPAAMSMQVDPTKKWGTHPVATRLIAEAERNADAASDLQTARRVTLSTGRLKVTRTGANEEHPVDRARWSSVLHDWFKITRPGPWPPER